MISETGFFSSDIGDDKEQLLAVYGTLFDVSTQLNELLMKLLSTAQMDITKEVHIVVHALAARSAELFQCIVMTLKTGSIPPANVLCRALIENAYKLVAVSSDPNYVEKLNSDEAVSRLSKLQGVQKYKQKYPGFVVASGIEKEIDCLVAKKFKMTNPHTWAELASMADFHNIYYPMLCDEVHANSASVSHYIDTQSEFALNFGPTDKGLPLTLTISNRTLVCCIESYAKFLMADIGAVLQVLSASNDAAEGKFLDEKKP